MDCRAFISYMTKQTPETEDDATEAQAEAHLASCPDCVAHMEDNATHPLPEEIIEGLKQLHEQNAGQDEDDDSS